MTDGGYGKKTCGMSKTLVDALRTAVADGDDATQNFADRVVAKFTGRSAAVMIAPPVGPSRVVAFNNVAAEGDKVFLVIWLLLDPTGQPFQPR